MDIKHIYVYLKHLQEEAILLLVSHLTLTKWLFLSHMALLPRITIISFQPSRNLQYMPFSICMWHSNLKRSAAS